MQYECTVRRPTTQDLTGQSFGRLTVLRFAGYRKYHGYWTCQCICGTMKDIGQSSLLCGDSQSCGCLRKALVSTRRTSHGRSHTPEHNIWCKMLRRCENPDDAAYDRYGGRGITVCEAWHVFAVFFRDMGAKPGKQYSIERLDNNGPYSKENCIWALPEVQNRNKRNNRILTCNGITQCLQDWALATGLGHKTITKRLDLGWSVEAALLTPPEQGRHPRYNKTHCIHGHPLEGGNLILTHGPDGQSARRCRTCARRRWRIFQRNKRQKHTNVPHENSE